MDNDVPTPIETVSDAAVALHGDQYGEEGSDELFEAMRQAGLVAVFGASDDLMEFCGAIYDEAYVFGGGRVYVDRDGLSDNDLDSDEEFDNSVCIEAVWDEYRYGEHVLWYYRTDIPHAEFEVYEGDDLYCIGIVFSIYDLPEGS